MKTARRLTVAVRLLRAVGALRWPGEALEIQVLDDSLDETRDLVDREVRALRDRGLDARVLRREGRAGFKAGALAHGLELARFSEPVVRRRVILACWQWRHEHHISCL